MLFLVLFQLGKLGLPFRAVADTPLEANVVQEVLALLGERSWLALDILLVLLALTGDLSFHFRNKKIKEYR